MSFCISSKTVRCVEDPRRRFPSPIEDVHRPLEIAFRNACQQSTLNVETRLIYPGPLHNETGAQPLRGAVTEFRPIVKIVSVRLESREGIFTFAVEAHFSVFQ